MSCIARGTVQNAIDSTETVENALASISEELKMVHCVSRRPSQGVRGHTLAGHVHRSSGGER